MVGRCAFIVRLPLPAAPHARAPRYRLPAAPRFVHARFCVRNAALRCRSAAVVVFTRRAAATACVLPRTPTLPLPFHRDRLHRSLLLPRLRAPPVQSFDLAVLLCRTRCAHVPPAFAFPHCALRCRLPCVCVVPFRLPRTCSRVCLRSFTPTTCPAVYAFGSALPILPRLHTTRSPVVAHAAAAMPHRHDVFCAVLPIFLPHTVRLPRRAVACVYTVYARLVCRFAFGCRSLHTVAPYPHARVGLHRTFPHTAVHSFTRHVLVADRLLPFALYTCIPRVCHAAAVAVLYVTAVSMPHRGCVGYRQFTARSRTCARRAARVLRADRLPRSAVRTVYRTVLVALHFVRLVARATRTRAAGSFAHVCGSVTFARIDRYVRTHAAVLDARAAFVCVVCLRHAPVRAPFAFTLRVVCCGWRYFAFAYPTGLPRFCTRSLPAYAAPLRSATCTLPLPAALLLIFTRPASFAFYRCGHTRTAHFLRLPFVYFTV